MPRRTCPDCDAAMERIEIIDKGHGGSHSEHVEYRANDAARSFWTGQFKAAGTVEWLMCRKCGRIVMYGKKA
jgi:uncharacterized OB-fold protein